MINSPGIVTSTSSHTHAGNPKRRVTPLRQRFAEHLVLQQKAKRTVQSYTGWIYDLAKFHHRSPDQLGQPEIRSWILHLITERNLSASSINLAINAVRAFYQGMLGQDIEPYFAGIKRAPASSSRRGCSASRRSNG